MTDSPLRATCSALLGVLLVALPVGARAQTTLGEILDAGATRVGGDSFNGDVVGRTLTGPLATGGELEILHSASGQLVGRGSMPGYIARHSGFVPIDGEWRLDDVERVCSTMHMFVGTGRSTSFPSRCQYWFKAGDVYYVSDSDSDRRAKVLKRTLKK